MRLMKRWLGGILGMVLLLGLLPGTALAAEADWATDAVNTLNGIYGSGVFSAENDGEMTVSDLTRAGKQHQL
ncbi:hypothetical protein [Pseudoflavonifractor phocaeensis]|uniref:hypothetical protein n=1 Tax=Pseudoflavonifractor phocaeensis TaxID=1870988 RepID=UPI00195E96FD|nr:hypothetical protein [Pseudoflavonifractor phocaeensis]MBM6925042.1 hypothetical protein [Pseudoflavonifractor phocaeensis]